MPEENTKTSGYFDLQLRFDSANRVVSIKVNDLTLPLPPSVEDPCCEDSDGTSFTGMIIPDTSTPATETTPAGPSLGPLLRLGLNVVVVIGAVLALQGLVYWNYFADDPQFLDRYGWWMVYLDLSVVPLIATLGYLRSYIYAHASHMMGMVIGMTIGMQVGTMIGGVLGATNGFFVGAMVGMSLGTLYGVLTAWCCGPMAVIHGLMAGVMGGTMGAMVVVMMIPDHVLIFMPVFTTANLLILIWFTYLFYKEGVAAGKCQLRGPLTLAQLSSFSLVTIGLLAALMVLGPKGPMVWKGHKRAAMDADMTENPFQPREPGKDGSSTDRREMEMACGARMMEGGNHR
ncbi:hypothetical protein [Methylococcus capsulatus]|uniref:hypothetical protein n=1 Tax=Methylococcus capsulatus TaxID=414 RepID=UPI001C532E69|nr:hypothetical protein [Methylococcus capsulatus]QXP92056.1 hypothetical protein KW114_08035 [Methylococcus capsulatus]